MGLTTVQRDCAACDKCIYLSIPNHVVSASSVGAFERKLQILGYQSFLREFIFFILLYFFLILHVLFPCVIICVFNGFLSVQAFLPLNPVKLVY